MSERATVFELVQLGVETTPGTGVAATKRLPGVEIAARPMYTSRRFRSRGRKFDTVVVQGRKWSGGDVTGALTYQDPVYILSSLYGEPTPTVLTATKSWSWVFTMNPSSADTPKTYTVELGSAAQAAKFVHGIFTGFGVEVTTEECNFTSAIIGKQWQKGITFTPSGVTELNAVPVQPQHWTVYADDSFATLGTTVLTRLLNINLGMTEKYSPLFVINRANSSWVAPVEAPPDSPLTFQLEANTQADGFLDTFDTGATKYIRLEAQGPNIPTTTDPYKIIIDCAVKVEDVTDLADADGVYAMSLATRVVDDGGSLRAPKVTINTDFGTL